MNRFTRDDVDLFELKID